MNSNLFVLFKKYLIIKMSLKTLILSLQPGLIFSNMPLTYLVNVQCLQHYINYLGEVDNLMLTQPGHPSVCMRNEQIKSQDVNGHVMVSYAVSRLQKQGSLPPHELFLWSGLHLYYFYLCISQLLA